MPRISQHLAVAAAVVLIPFVLGARELGAQLPTRSFAKADAEFADPFSSVAAIRELRTGRVMVADVRDKVVQLVDLKSGAAVKVGREGSGPGEYGLPTQLFALGGDTTLVFDPLNQRYLVVGPDGKPGATFRIGDDPAAGAAARPQQGSPRPDGGEIRLPGGMAMGMPRAADARGRLYFEGSGITIGPNGPATADSAPITRYDRRTRRSDTVTWVHLPKNNAQVSTSGSGGERNMRVTIGSRSPFPARDTWTVAPNGNVIVVRVKDYHVDVISPTGSVARGPAVPYEPVRVGAAEKEEYRTAAKSAPGVAIMRTTAQGAAGTRNQQSVGAPPFEEPKEWPAVKPPFTNNVFASPTGEIWVPRSRKASDETPAYDIFSATGRLVGRAVLPPKTRVIGFGTSVVYTLRTDDDDLQYLQRFRA